jgi:outer membrane protein
VVDRTWTEHLGPNLHEPPAIASIITSVSVSAPSFRRAGVVLLLFVAFAWTGTAPVQAQQKIGYVDSEYILDRLPEYATVQQKLDQLERQWREEITEARRTVDELRQEFQARELLYTEEERARKKEEITEARRDVETLRQRYFGPDGELYARQEELMRPIQERVLAAVEEVATGEGYDYVFDKGGDYVFMYARDQYDLSDRVLRELGIDVERSQQ